MLLGSDAKAGAATEIGMYLSFGLGYFYLGETYFMRTNPLLGRPPASDSANSNFAASAAAFAKQRAFEANALVTGIAFFFRAGRC